MPVSRRSFLGAISPGTAAYSPAIVAARGREAFTAGRAVRRVPVDRDGRLDLDAMAQAARWAGLVFLSNPNNPTSTLHPARAVADFIARVGLESPETAILVDEAYHDYVTDPGYATAVPL